jgi:hypothetical protein
MRKCVSRCHVCGGRKLEFQEVGAAAGVGGGGGGGDGSSDVGSVGVGCQYGGDENELLDISDDVFNDPEPGNPGDPLVREKNGSDVSNGENKWRTSSDELPSILSPAGAVLQKDFEYMSPLKTSQLAEGTPGKLPGLFLRLLRRRVSSKIMNESRRRSFNKFFHLTKSPLKFTTSNSGSSTCSTVEDGWEDGYFDKETTNATSGESYLRFLIALIP